MGFNGPGQAAQFFNDHPENLPAEVSDALLQDGKITAGELVDLNCTTPPERR